MTRPRMPTGSELERAEKAHPGSAKIMLEAYVSAVNDFQSLQVRQFDDLVANASKL